MTADSIAARYAGRTVVCAASGPSLAAEDLAAVRGAGLPVFVVNNSWQLAPWADVLVAMDTAWWLHYGAAAVAGFAGARVGWTAASGKLGAQCTAHGMMLPNFGNSGAAAIALAARGRAARVLLLGYDAQAASGGALHWHADHPAPLKNPLLSINRWPQQFERAAVYAKKQGARVINCSRRTALRCFPIQTLEEALRTPNHSGTSGASTSAASGTRTPAVPPRLSATGPGPSITGAT